MPPSPTVPPTAPDVEPTPSIESTLSGGHWGLVFPRALERAFQEDTKRMRARRLKWCNLLAVLSFWLISSGSRELLPPQADGVWMVRQLAIVLPLLLMGLLWLRPIERTPAWMFDAVTTFGMLLMSAYGILGSAAGVMFDLQLDVVGHVKVGGLFLIFMYSGLLARQSFFHTLGVSSLILVSYALLNRPHEPLSAVLVEGHLHLFATAMLFTLGGNYLLEHRERRAYLLRRIEAGRQQALADSAEQLRLLSIGDPLTGLFNRRHFDAELNRLWAQSLQDGMPVALLLLDVDFFKRFNDHHGHQGGDTCLRRVADVVADIGRRHGAVVARVGGEEFAVLLAGPAAAEPHAVGEAVCAAVRALAVPHGASPIAAFVTVSVGATAARADSKLSPQLLYRVADDAMYAAKQAGRNAVRFLPAVAAGPTDLGSEDGAARPPVLPDPLAAVTDRIARLTAVLRRSGHRLRFPAELEAQYRDSVLPHRRRWLVWVGAAGLLYLTGYVWFGQPLFADAARTVITAQLALDVAGIATIAVLTCRMAWWLHEAVFAGAVTVLGVGLVAALSQSQMVTVYSYALSLFLLPMFTSVIAAQPFWFASVPAVAITAAAALLLRPPAGAGPVLHAAWQAATMLIVLGTLYSVITGYLLERSMRREYLLRCLDAAEREVLTATAERLRRLATEDALTGLANRRRFEAELARVWSECAASGQPAALLVIDVDHFKRYNDGYGHQAGDRCLRRIAAALAQAADAAGATVARLGGEEFGLLLPRCDLPQALLVADRLCGRLRGLRIAHDHSLVADHVTVSVGAASAIADGRSTGQQLLTRADAALYRAKSRGRDRAAA